MDIPPHHFDFSHSPALEPTPLCVDKIEAILTLGSGPKAFPVYWSGAAQRQAVGPPK